MMESLRLLEQGRMPERYLRNLGTTGIAGQLKLCRARVAIIGAGGLGGLALELLARMGVGFLRVVDGDVFAVHNLNRQLLATQANLGLNKAEAAALRAAAINPEVSVDWRATMLTRENACSLLEEVDLTLDCLDSIPARLLLSEAARERGIPLIHAAIAGCSGRIMTVYPQDHGLERLYPDKQVKGAEQELGNPAATPALAAALQVQEAVKVITGNGEPLRNKLLCFDTEWNLFEIMEVG